MVLDCGVSGMEARHDGKSSHKVMRIVELSLELERTRQELERTKSELYKVKRDAEPVRHAKWVQSNSVPSYHFCSGCKRAHKMPMSCNVYVLPYYCPNCGAKMDKEEK